jgi:phi13 family phage major tail protein
MGITRPRIGIESVVYALLTESSDVVGGTPIYGTVKSLAGAAKLTVNQNGTVATDYFDDGPGWVGTTTGKIQVSLELADFQEDAYAEILGVSRSNGINADNSLDTAPYIAFGYKQWLGGLDGSLNKVYVYKWLLKGKFSKPQQGGTTKKDTLAPEHTTISGEFAKLNAGNIYQTSARTDDSAVSATTLTNWFNQPVVTNSVSLSAVTVGSATGSISGKTITIPFSKGSSETFNLVAPTNGNQITISVVSTGLLLAGTNSYAVGTAGTAPTITITNANIANVAYLVNVVNVVDTNGVVATQKSQLVTPV